MTRMRSQSQRQIREILDTMPAGVYACDADGRLSFYNRRAVELWGREPNPHDHRWALRGAWRAYQHGRPLRPNKSPVAHVLKTGEAIINCELAIERPNHSRIDILVNVSPLHDADRTVVGVVSVFHDITEHKRAEEALQWHHKLTMAMEATRAGWCDWDWVTGETLWSENAKRIMGFKTEEDARSAEGWLRRVHPEDLPRVEADTRQAADEHRDFYCEYRIIHPDGDIRHLLGTGRILYDENDRPIRSTGLVIDITERKRTEEALRKSELQLTGELEAMVRLHELVTRLLGYTDLRTALEEVLSAAITLLGADMGNIQLLNPQNNSLEIVAHRGFRKDFLDYFQAVRVGEGAVCGRALEWSERVLIEDVQIDQAFEPHRAIAASAGFRAVQSTPLMSRSGRLLGILSTHFRKPHLPSERDLRVLDLYARQAADFIERVRREDTLRESGEHY